MKPLFVDTWAWVALADQRDPWHSAAVEIHRQSHGFRRYVTTDYVLSEAITLLFRRCHFKPAKDFTTAILDSCHAGQYRLVAIAPAQFLRAWELRTQFDDKPEISFVDLTSMGVMQDEGISEAFTGDEHFLHVNLGFTLLPIR